MGLIKKMRSFGTMAVGGILLWGGFQEAYTCIRNPAPLEASFVEFVNHPPNAEWLRIKDARYSLLEAMYREDTKTNKITELYIPVYAATEDESAPAKMVLLSKDPGQIALVTQWRATEDNDEAIAEFTEKNAKGLFYEGAVEGVLQFGISSKDSSRKTIVQLSENAVAPNFALIALNEKPSWGLSLFLSALGSLSLGFGALRFLRRR